MGQGNSLVKVARFVNPATFLSGRRALLDRAAGFYSLPRLQQPRAGTPLSWKRSPLTREGLIPKATEEVTIRRTEERELPLKVPGYHQ